jgi:hypothetical protein
LNDTAVVVNLVSLTLSSLGDEKVKTSHVHKLLRESVVAAVTLLTIPASVLAEPMFEWLSDWEVEFVADSPEHKGNQKTYKAFGESANNGQITNIADDRALLRSYAWVRSKIGESSRAKDEMVTAKRRFRLSGAPGGWKVDLKGQLEGVLTSNSKTLNAFARVWYEAQIRDSNGTVTHDFSGYQEAEDKAKFISGEGLLDSKSLVDGDYEVMASLKSQAGTNASIPPLFTGGGAADFYNKEGEGLYKDVKPGPKGWWVSVSTAATYTPDVTPMLELLLLSPMVLEGDLNSDGLLDVSDYQIFRSTLGKCEGQTDYLSEADYDDDGCITYADYRIWNGYYRNR